MLKNKHTTDKSLTTIPQGSTLQAIGGGKDRDPLSENKGL